MGRIAGKKIGCHCSIAWHRRGTLIIGMLCTACLLLLASELKAQCTARDVLQNQLRLKKTPSASTPQSLIRSAADAPVWKTIKIGTFSDTFALIGALEAGGCGIGNLAGEILAQPAFSLRATMENVDLFAVSVAELGFQSDTTSLADIYARAKQLGFALAPAEIAPQ